jgi:hypothetical protein
MIRARIDAPASVAPGVLFQIGVQVQGPANHPVDVELEADAEGVRKTDTRHTTTNPGGEVVVYFDVNAGRGGTVALVARVRLASGQQVIATHDVAIV